MCRADVVEVVDRDAGAVVVDTQFQGKVVCSSLDKHCMDDGNP